MNKYAIITIVFAIFYIIIAVAINKMGEEKVENKIKKSRSKKGGHDRNARYSGSSIKKQLEHVVSEKADVKKKYKIETMCLQAGHELSYGEYKIICFSVALALPILMLMVMKNIYLAVVFGFIGFHIPGQYMKTMANKRVKKMEMQVGSFIRMILERYKTNKDMAQSITQTLPDFHGLTPFYDVLKNATAEIRLGIPTEDVIDNMVRKTGNKFLSRFSDYYKMTDNLTTHEAKIDLLNQAYEQYQEDCDMKAMLKEKISGPVNEAYIMVGATPAFMTYQAIFSDGYLDFMINTEMGQVGIAGIIGVLLLCIWFINAKIGAPLD